MPKVSVIVPVYGVEKYIERCARSLFEQTLDDIEYLFIDDCTPDRSVEILRSVLEEYPHRKEQVVIHRMEHNAGQAIVRKWGIQNATGEYVIHCDSDDWVDMDMYRAMYEKAMVERAELVVCDYSISDGTQVLFSKIGCHAFTPLAFFESIMNQVDIGALWNKMFKRKPSLTNIVWAEGAMGEDLLLSLQMVYDIESIAYIPVPYYYYYENPISITKSLNEQDVLRRFNESIKNANGLLTFFKENHLYVKYRNNIDRLLLNKRNLLLPLLNIPFYYDLWKNTFPELNNRVLLNTSIPFRDRIKFLLVLLRIVR